MNSIYNNVAIQWLIRRVPDWGGWIGTNVALLVGIYSLLPARSQEAVMMVIEGNWQGITLGALVPIGAVVYAQVISFRSTTKPKEVEKVAGKSVEVSAPRKSLWDILQGK